MYKQWTSRLSLVGALALGLAACSSAVGVVSPGAGNDGGTGDTGGTGGDSAPTALTIQGTFQAPGGAGLRPSAQRSMRVAESVTAYADLLVSCVTFTNPPVAGSGGTVGATGSFTVTFPDGTIGSNFGCFISAPADDTFMPIPMVFVDPTKTGLDGNPAQSTRLAVTASVEIPSIALDLDAGTAVADVTTLRSADTTGTTQDVVKTATGTKFDFGGSWTIGPPSTATLPDGYIVPCTSDQAFEAYWTAATTGQPMRSCDGPMVGMKIYMQRLDGRDFTPDATCAAAASQEHGGPITACDGTIGTDERYAIQLWAGGQGGGDICHVSHPPQVTDDTKETCKAKWVVHQASVASPQTTFETCGRKLGFTNVEARARGHLDLTSDPNYVASGSFTGAGDTHYYDGPFPFATSITLISTDLFGTCTQPPCKPFSQAQNNVTEGWKLDHAQLMWPQQNNCSPASVLVGGTKAQAWRCFGTWYPNCTEQPPANCTNTTGTLKPAFNEGTGLGCIDTTGKAVQFTNQNDFWCQASDMSPGHTCNVPCTAGDAVSWVDASGAITAAGYNVSVCQAKQIDGAATTFVPRDSSGQAIAVTGAVTCRSGGGLFDATVPTAPVLMQTYNAWQKFRPTQSPAGQLCADMLANTNATGADLDRLKLAQLQCYAQAYHRANSTFTGCSRNMQFNWGTANWWEFETNDKGPTLAQGEVMVELFTYTDTNAGTFSNVQTRMTGVQAKDSNGYDTWINCRLNQTDSVTVTAVSATELQLELTSVVAMPDRSNATCVAAVDEGTIRTGTQKMVFTMTKP